MLDMMSKRSLVPRPPLVAFFVAVEKPTRFSMAAKKVCEGRPAYEVRVSILSKQWSSFELYITDAPIIRLAIGKLAYWLISHNIGVRRYSFANSYYACMVCKVA